MESHRLGKHFTWPLVQPPVPTPAGTSTRSASQTSVSRELPSDTSQSQIYLQSVCLLGCVDQNPQPVRSGGGLGESESDTGFGPRGLIQLMHPTFIQCLLQPKSLRQHSCQVKTAMSEITRPPPLTPVHHSANFTFQKEKGLT